jgi:hypothetical protein
MQELQRLLVKLTVTLLTAVEPGAVHRECSAHGVVSTTSIRLMKRFALGMNDVSTCETQCLRERDCPAPSRYIS